MDLLLKIALQKVMNVYSVDRQWQHFMSSSNIINKKVMN